MRQHSYGFHYSLPDIILLVKSCNEIENPHFRKTYKADLSLEIMRLILPEGGEYSPKDIAKLMDYEEKKSWLTFCASLLTSFLGYFSSFLIF